MNGSPILGDLIESLRGLPGVGQKTAQRMAFYLLDQRQELALKMAQSLTQAVQNIRHCQQCRMLTEYELCMICQSQKRDRSKLCVVETQADVLALEQGAAYDGLYFVLMGHLSPIDGIGPEELGFSTLRLRLAEPNLKELILATNPTVEGEATAQYLADMAKAENLSVTRLAHGIPIGGELEYVDGRTLSHAFSGRQQYL